MTPTFVTITVKGFAGRETLAVGANAVSEVDSVGKIRVSAAQVAEPQLAVVPEASTLTLTALGAVRLLSYGWRRRRSN